MRRRSRGVCAAVAASALVCAVFGAPTASGHRDLTAISKHHAARPAPAGGNPHGGPPGQSGGGPPGQGSGGGTGLGGDGGGQGGQGGGNPHGGPPGQSGGGPPGQGNGGGGQGGQGVQGGGNPHGGPPGQAGGGSSAQGSGSDHGNPHVSGTHGNPHQNGAGGNPHFGTGSPTPQQQGNNAGTTTGATTSTVITGSPGTGSTTKPLTGSRPGNNPGTGTGTGTGTGAGTGTGTGTGSTGGGTPSATTTSGSFRSTPSLFSGDRAGGFPTGAGTLLGLTTGRSPTGAGALGAFALPLAPGVGTLQTLTAGGVTGGPGSATTTLAGIDGPAAGHGDSNHTDVIQRIVSVVPGIVWLVFGISLGLAALGAGAAFWSGRRVRRQAGQFAAVTAAALTDALTGVLNRRGFVDAVERELARAKRYGRQFVLAYVDVRGLKAVNDSEGHLAGDRLLKEAAQLLRDSARADDVVGRLGGDEMGLLLVEQGTDGAAAVVNRIASQVPERRAEIGLHSSWDLTIGTATYPVDGETVNELLATADRRLYEQRGIALS